MAKAQPSKPQRQFHHHVCPFFTVASPNRGQEFILNLADAQELIRRHMVDWKNPVATWVCESEGCVIGGLSG